MDPGTGPLKIYGDQRRYVFLPHEPSLPWARRRLDSPMLHVPFPCLPPPPSQIMQTHLFIRGEKPSFASLSILPESRLPCSLLKHLILN